MDVIQVDDHVLTHWRSQQIGTNFGVPAHNFKLPLHDLPDNHKYKKTYFGSNVFGHKMDCVVYECPQC